MQIKNGITNNDQRMNAGVFNWRLSQNTKNVKKEAEMQERWASRKVSGQKQVIGDERNRKRDQQKK